MRTDDASPGGPPLVDMPEIIRLVGALTHARGQQDARRGKVLSLDWDPVRGSLRSEVQGTGPEPHRCTVALQARPGSHRLVASHCTCSLEGSCQHVVATVLHGNQLHLLSGRLGLSAGHALAQSRGPQWEGELLRLITAAPSAARPGASATGSEPAPLALQFEIRVPEAAAHRRGPRGVVEERRLGIRPVVWSAATSRWLRSGVSWQGFSRRSASGAFRPDHFRWFQQVHPLQLADAADHWHGRDPWIYLDDFASPLLWPMLAQATELGIEFQGSRKGSRVQIGEAARLSLEATEEPEEGLRLRPVLSINGEPLAADVTGTISDHGVYALLLGRGVETIQLAPSGRVLSAGERAMLHSPPVLIPAKERAEFLTGLYPRLARVLPVVSGPDGPDLPVVHPPTLLLSARFGPEASGSGLGASEMTAPGVKNESFPEDDVLRLRWFWEYRLGEAITLLPLHAVPDRSAPGERDLAVEEEILHRVSAALAGGPLGTAPLRDAELYGLDAADLTEHGIPAVEAIEGARVELIGEPPAYGEAEETPELQVSTVESERRDWFDLGVVVRVGGQRIPFDHVFRALALGQNRVLMPDKRWFRIDTPEILRLRRLIEESRELREWEADGGATRPPRLTMYQAGLWDELAELAGAVEEAPRWREAMQGLLDPGALHPVPIAAGLNAEMRPYQREGFQWLAFLWRHGLGGVLADDMGLGKTLQTLALLAHARESAPGAPPFLVVAPTSVTTNWIAEAERFTPGLKTTALSDTQAKARTPLSESTAGADVVVTSYALFRLDFAAYSALPWSGLILDEAQFVKNKGTRAHRCALELDAPFKLALSGTPLENNLMELWALFAIVAPGLFPPSHHFAQDFQKPVETNGDAEKLARLRRRIRPLMLRRTKEAVASELPEKLEQRLDVELSPRHRRLYQQYLQREREKVLGLVEDLDRNRFIVFRSLTLLRLMALDPSLVDEEHEGVSPAKLDILLEQLQDVISEGHRALVFSQFTSFLGKAAARLDHAGIPYEYLDGSTRHRAEVIGRFKEGSSPVFLISLKAGGFGLNLTEADYCFLLDPWWNPAAEAQAVDRAHRIGQTRRVMSYRLVAKDTIEEKVMALKERKSALFSSVLDDGAVFSSGLTAEDIRGLLE